MIIRLSRDQVNWLIEEAGKHWIETCGAVFGHIHCGEATVKEIVRLRNTLNSPIAFQIDPEEFLRELRRAEDMGLEHIGFFHSHPGPAEPSAIDVKFMRLWPESIWLIVSSTRREVAAYRVVDENVYRVQIEML